MTLDSDAITHAREAILGSVDLNNHPDKGRFTAEALFFMCGGEDAGLIITGHDNHWWIQDERGYIWDPSWDLFPSTDYSKGKKITISPSPSEDAKILMDRIEFELIGFTDY